jgi:hypothetical protein
MDNLVPPILPQAAALVMCVLAASPVDAATTTLRNGDNLQAALNNAQPGDTILLEPGAVFTGNFVLPVKPGASFITVATAPDPRHPAAGARVSPLHAPALARIQSGNTMAALATAAGAQHWRLQLLEFPANRDGFGEIIQLGDGSSAQNQLSQVPYQIELDRVYIHGDPVKGQKRGIALNAASVSIRNSYIAEIKGVGIDTQAVGGWNGPGPFVLENNYLEAAGENFMLGGADPSIPNLVSENVIIRSNHFTRPMAWRNPVVPNVTGVAATPQAGGGLAAGTYTYEIIARVPVGGGAVARSAASAPVAATAPANGRIALTWTPVANASEYQVYGRSPFGVSQFWVVTAPSFTDSGVPGTLGTTPTGSGSGWTVKNLLELKNARNVVIEQNVFENHWAGAQAGYAIVFTPRNQNGHCTWCVVEDVSFRQNIVRNVASGINILGFDDIAPSRQTRGIRITQNLFAGITQTLGGNGWFLLMGNGPADITIDHNTIDADGTTISYVYGGVAGGILPVYGYTFNNNAARHSNYGINGSDVAFGNAIIAAFFPDGEVRGNWLQGGLASRYPAGNYFDDTFAAGFVALPSDYNARVGGPLWGRATDGTNIGADIATLWAAVSGVVQGTLQPSLSAPSNLRVVKSQ